MGNRLSAHTVQSVKLIAEHDDDNDVPDPEPNTVEETEIVITPEDKTVVDTPPAKTVEPVAEVPDEPVEMPEQSAESPKESVQSKKVDFEITNPEDLDIDDKGQLGLF